MTATTPARVPGDLSGHPALSRLVALPVERFAADSWGVRPLLSAAEDLPAPFTDLFSDDAVDELVSRRALRTPFLRLAKDGATLPEPSFTSGGGTGAAVPDQVSEDRLLQHFADGATMVLQGLHRTWPPLVAFCQQLAADLGHPVQANAYVTPPQSRGFGDHYDVHDVFVLQVAGEKQWRIHEPVHPAPLPDQPWTDHRAAVEAAAADPPLLETVLRPGDCLYLPRGYLHAATALGDVSTHVTLGIHAWTRRHLAEELTRVALARASEDPSLRGSLPLGADVSRADGLGADVERVRAALLDALRDADTGDLLDGLAARARASQRAEPLAPLAQLRAADEVSPDGRVRLRAHLAAQLSTPVDGYAVLSSRAGRFRVAEADLAGVTALLEAGRAPVSLLGTDLARRLLRAGIALPA